MGSTDETNKVSTVSNESKTVRKVKFKLKDSDNGVLLKIHHTVSQNRRLLRIRFVNACFSHDNEKLFAVDHRSSIFIFSLTGLKYWVLENCIVSVTAIESIPNTNQVLLGNKEGLVVSIDTDTGIELMRLKAHHTRIERISFPSWFAKQHQKQETQHPQTNSHPSRKQGARCLEKASDSHGTQDQQTAKSSKNTLMPMFLVTASECAKLYDARNFVELHQLNYGTADSMKRIEHLQWAPRAGLLLGCGLDGRLWLWKTDFKLAKELNLLKMRTSYLNKFQMEYVTVTCDEEQPLLCEGQDESKRKVDRVIQSMTADGRTKGFVKSAQFTLGGKFLMLNCMDHSLIILNCDSWQVCKILALSGLFITHFEIVHVDRQHSSRAKAQEFLMLVKNVESDLLLMNLEDGSKSYIVHSPESKCYKFRLSNNSKMLANVLKSGEILLHNLEFHSCALKANKLQQSAVVVSTPTGKTHPRPSKTTASTSIIVQRQRRTTGEPATNSNLATPSNASLYTVAPAATVASSGSTSTGQIVSVFRKESKLKIEKRLEEIHDKISKTLVKNRLLPILKEFGEYPEKHRSTIWRTVLELPHNVNCFNALLLQGYHSCVADYDRKFSSYDSRMVRNMKKIVSCLANWSAVFAQCDFVPFFVHPFIRLYPNDSLTCFETVATVLLNHCQLWFEFAPLEPFNYLGMIENILCEYEPKLMNFYRTRHISSRVYGLTLMETAFAENFDANQWLRLWDHILSNEPYFMLFFVVAYNAGHRTTIINCTNEKDIEVFFHGPSLIDIGKLLKRTYDVAERCAESIHPKYYMKSFVPLNGIAANEVKSSNLASRHKPNQCYKPNQLRNLDNKNPVKSTYSKFNNFPKQLVDVRAGEINCLKAEQQRLEAKIVEMEKLEHMLKDRMVDNLIQEEHDKRMKEVERKYEEALVGEEQRIEMQRKLLLLHKKQLRERENEILTESRNSLLRQSAAAREYELETLLKTLQQERQREEMDFMFAEEDIKQREMELLARRYDTNTKLTDDGSLEQRYQQAIQQLDRQKQRLYEEIERDYERNLKHLDSQLETLFDIQEK
ncbi:TBC1 domain family member 31 isoform X2 [Armigeres subalbatus]|uniref:TBC1 domain family member 31 isoform X2 n=1 Tax=Armigeres subalbatus TaxID=124917 RepID=UPI002ED2A930